MGIVNYRKRAAQAPVPVYAVIGPGQRAAVERLLARPGIHNACTPRDAGLLLVAGTIPDAAAEAVGRVHDQLPNPRATVTWIDQADIEDVLRNTWREVCSGTLEEDDRRPDVPPNEWKGVGPNGQGGKGMMGGTPYGRPMAMTGPDVRDGLQLDRYTARVGPFAPMLPPGLVLEVTLQGDVICEAVVQSLPFVQSADADAPDLCAARMLRLLGLDGAADRVVAGQRPRAFGILTALPPDLGTFDGTGSARDRLRAWLRGETASGSAPGLPKALVGLEWSEAMLLIASFTPSSILHASRGTEAT